MTSRGLSGDDVTRLGRFDVATEELINVSSSDSFALFVGALHLISFKSPFLPSDISEVSKSEVG